MQLTLVGFAILASFAAVLIAAASIPGCAGAASIAASRLCDGLDGAVARHHPAHRPSAASWTSRWTFIFYASDPAGLCRSPTRRATRWRPPCLLAAFAWARWRKLPGLRRHRRAAKRHDAQHWTTPKNPSTSSAASPRPPKPWPALPRCACGRSTFALLAYGFAALCAITTADTPVVGLAGVRLSRAAPTSRPAPLFSSR
jgi:hypothetical protein